MESVMMVVMAAIRPMQNIGLRLLELAPIVIAGLILLLVGVFLSRFIRDMLDRMFHAIKLDDHLKVTGIHDLLHRMGLGHSLSRLIGIVVHAVILLSFILGAADVMGLVIVSTFIRELVWFMPTLIGVVLVLGGGLFVGHLAGHVVHGAATANNVRGADVLSKGTFGLLVIFAGILALRLLGIEISIITGNMSIIIASIGLGAAIAFGVAFGLAGREHAERILRDLIPRNSSRNGSSDKKHKKVRFRRAA